MNALTLTVGHQMAPPLRGSRKTLASRLWLTLALFGAFSIASFNSPNAEAKCQGCSKATCQATAANSYAAASLACTAYAFTCGPAYVNCLGACLAGATAAWAAMHLACNACPCP